MQMQMQMHQILNNDPEYAHCFTEYAINILELNAATATTTSLSTTITIIIFV